MGPELQSGIIGGLLGLIFGAASAAFTGVKLMGSQINRLQIEVAQLTTTSNVFASELKNVREDRHDQIERMVSKQSEVIMFLMDLTRGIAEKIQVKLPNV